jgi:hypothetical protein
LDSSSTGTGSHLSSFEHDFHVLFARDISLPAAPSLPPRNFEMVRTPCGKPFGEDVERFLDVQVRSLQTAPRTGAEGGSKHLECQFRARTSLGNRSGELMVVSSHARAASRSAEDSALARIFSLRSRRTSATLSAPGRSIATAGRMRLLSQGAYCQARSIML